MTPAFDIFFYNDVWRLVVQGSTHDICNKNGEINKEVLLWMIYTGLCVKSRSFDPVLTWISMATVFWIQCLDLIVIETGIQFTCFNLIVPSCPYIKQNENIIYRFLNVKHIVLPGYTSVYCCCLLYVFIWCWMTFSFAFIETHYKTAFENIPLVFTNLLSFENQWRLCMDKWIFEDSCSKGMVCRLRVELTFKLIFFIFKYRIRR